MIGENDIDTLRLYLTRFGMEDPYNPNWYSLNGLEINIDADCVYVYLIRDKWLVACTMAGRGGNCANPHRIIVVDFDGLMRLLRGGEMAYNNMENEHALEELR